MLEVSFYGFQVLFEIRILQVFLQVVFHTRERRRRKLLDQRIHLYELAHNILRELRLLARFDFQGGHFILNDRLLDMKVGLNVFMPLLKVRVHIFIVFIHFLELALHFGTLQVLLVLGSLLRLFVLPSDLRFSILSLPNFHNLIEF